jgi:diguanylate cyclase (GGDEF)-like protein
MLVQRSAGTPDGPSSPHSPGRGDDEELTLHPDFKFSAVQPKKGFMTDSDSKASSAKPGKAPVASVAAIKIVQLATRPDCAAGELAELATSDPAFAMRLLSVVNSAAFGRSNKVKDVHQAASLLGVRRLRSLALGLVVTSMAPKNEAGNVLLASSMRRAVAAAAIAEALKLDEDAAFTIGLFLEVGLLPVATQNEAVAQQVVSSPASQRALRERELGLASHSESGAALAASFELPQSLVEAIRTHHDSQPPAETAGRVAWLAERMAAVFEGGPIALNRRAALDAAAALGIEETTATKLLESIPERVRKSGDSLDRDLGEQRDLEELVLDANRSLVEMNDQYEELIQRLESVIAEKEQIAQELSAANKQLAMYASTDALTGIPNKRAFTEALTRDLAQIDRTKSVLSLIVIDVDHFKKFNDTWGHSTGDEVLRAVGKVLAAQLRSGDMAARYGGEEFVIILPNTDPEGAHIAAERVRAALEVATIDGPKGKLSVTASFGVATVRGPGCRDASEDLFKRADAALYEAKRSGRNRVALAA